MLSKHVNSVCKSAFFSVSNVGRIGKYLDRDKCFLLYFKLKLSFMGIDRSLPGLLDFGMHSIFLRVKLEDPCAASAIEYRDHIIVEYRDYCYIMNNMYRV